MLNTITNKLPVIDYIILDPLKSELKSDECHLAYKEDYSAILCSYVVLEEIQYYSGNSLRSSVFTVFLHLSKAFDKI